VPAVGKSVLCCQRSGDSFASLFVQHWHYRAMQPMIEKQFPIRGAHCNGCLQTIERALRGVEGVTDVRATLDNGGSVAVTYDPTKASPDALRRAVEQVGYELIVRQ
ncbi:MAG: heavy-metal-associated domain-containing protein, partial [Chlorobi bacterium]|nr:heavy-metal-associated domain-containing protein [Chlorobiota bacterium]